MLKNIIYVTHAEKGPSGGAKIIYKHSQIINHFIIRHHTVPKMAAAFRRDYG